MGICEKEYHFWHITWNKQQANEGMISTWHLLNILVTRAHLHNKNFKTHNIWMLSDVLVKTVANGAVELNTHPINPSIYIYSSEGSQISFQIT